MDFIKRLIRHIPEKHFKMVRYYGIYARHRESDKNFVYAIPDFKHPFYLSLTNWRNPIAYSFGYVPLTCSSGNQMSLLEIFHNHKRVPLDEVYRKAVEKLRLQFLS